MTLTQKVQQAAFELAIAIPDTGLALLYWDRNKECRVFILDRDNFHFRAALLDGIYEHRSEIIPLGEPEPAS